MTMNALILLLTVATSTLVLRSGDRITVQGPIREENGVITFRQNGLLYSIPASEIVDETPAPAAKSSAEDVRRLKLSPEERDRRLRELERNHSGTPAPPEQLKLQPPPPPPTPAEAAATKREEQYWRARAREHEESVRRAYEELQLLEGRIEELKSQIHALVSLGYKPFQFTYQSTRLARAIEQIPAAQLDIARAERAQAQFREDARRDGILPGWLR